MIFYRYALVLFFMVSVVCYSVAETMQKIAVVEQAWSRATPPRAMAGVVYLTILNNGEQDIALIGVESDVAKQAMVHTTQEDAQGRMTMMHADKLIVPAKGEITLAPGGHHIMLMGLKHPLVSGTEIALKLLFEGGQSQRIRVPVKSLRYRPEAQ